MNMVTASVFQIRILAQRRLARRWAFRAAAATWLIAHMLVLTCISSSAFAQQVESGPSETSQSVEQDLANRRLVIANEIKESDGFLAVNRRVFRGDGHRIHARDLAAGVDDPELQGRVARELYKARGLRIGVTTTGAALTATGAVLAFRALVLEIGRCLFECDPDPRPGRSIRAGVTLIALGAPLIPIGFSFGNRRARFSSDIYNFESPERVEELVDEYNRRLEAGHEPVRRLRRLPPAVEMGFRTDRGFSVLLGVRF